MKQYDVVIYCDGSAELSDGSGGWAAILLGRRGKRREYKQGRPEGHTNQTAEIMAAILGLSKLKRDNLRVLIRSDSQYVCKTFSEGWIEDWKRKGWRGKGGGERPNRALWETLESLVVLHKCVDFEHVKGHNGNVENERADVLANEGRRTAVYGARYFEQQLEIRRLSAEAAREYREQRGRRGRRGRGRAATR